MNKQLLALCIFFQVSLVTAQEQTSVITNEAWQRAMMQNFFQNQQIPHGYLINGGMSQSQNPLDFQPYYSRESFSELAPLYTGISPYQYTDFTRNFFRSGLSPALDQEVNPQNNSCENATIIGEQPDRAPTEPTYVDKFTFTDLTDQPKGYDDEGNPCGYRFGSKKATFKELRDSCIARNNIIEGTIPDPPELLDCHITNCTYATYLGIVKLLQTHDNYRTMTKRKPLEHDNGDPILDEEGNPTFETAYRNGEAIKLIDELKCRPCPNEEPNDRCKGGVAGWGMVASQFNKVDGLNRLTQYLRDNYGIEAENQKIQQDEFNEMADQGIPRQGDPITVYRKSGGHAVIFSNYRRDADNNVTHLCYWSSNSLYDGTAVFRQDYKEGRNTPWANYRRNQAPDPATENGNRCEPVVKPSNINQPTWEITGFSHSTGFDQKQAIYPIPTIRPMSLQGSAISNPINIPRDRIIPLPAQQLFVTPQEEEQSRLQRIMGNVFGRDN